MTTQPRAALTGDMRYEKIHDLYSDSHGSVKLCGDKVTGEKVAIKFIERGAKIDDNLKYSIVNHMGLFHQHIIAFKEVMLLGVSRETHLCVVMEYASGGDLLEFVRTHGVNEAQARWLFQQLIIALDYCHKMGIVCREIKLENALLDNSLWPILRLNAFHYSKRLGVQDTKSLFKPKGSPVYLAPELIDCKATHCQTAFKAVDVWQCGVFLYAMLFHSYPFCRTEDHMDPDPLKKLLVRTFQCEVSFPEGNTVSEECKDLIRRIFTHSNGRITLEEIRQHPWFTKDLPPGALELNHNMKLRKRTKHQSKADVEKIVQEARALSQCQE